MIITVTANRVWCCMLSLPIIWPSISATAVVIPGLLVVVWCSWTRRLLYMIESVQDYSCIQDFELEVL